MSEFGGVYRGVCTTAADPEGLLRIKVRVPQVLGQHETDWAWPCVPPGWGQNLHTDHVFTDNDTGEGAGGSATETLTHTLHRKTPQPGQAVWVMFEAGDVSSPVWMGVLR